MFACSILCGTGQSPATHVADCAAHGIKPVIGAGILAGQRKLARRGISGIAGSTSSKIIEIFAIPQKKHMFVPISSLVTDGRDGHEGIRYCVKCRPVAKPGTVAPLCWSDEAHSGHLNIQQQPLPIASWRNRRCPLFVNCGLTALSRPALPLPF